MISFIPRQSMIQFSIGFVLIPAHFPTNSKSQRVCSVCELETFHGSQRGRGGGMRTHVGRNCVQTGMDDRVTRSTRCQDLPASQKQIKRDVRPANELHTKANCHQRRKWTSVGTVPEHLVPVVGLLWPLLCQKGPAPSVPKVRCHLRFEGLSNVSPRNPLREQLQRDSSAFFFSLLGRSVTSTPLPLELNELFVSEQKKNRIQFLRSIPKIRKRFRNLLVT
jgi:hypothetical protein